MGIINSLMDTPLINSFIASPWDKGYYLLRDIFERDQISPDIYLDDIYNFNTGLPVNTINMYYRLESNDYFFHGTKACSALLIMRDGFKIAPPGSKVSGAMLGPGVYLSDNVRKTFAYGEFVFFCKISPKNQLEVKNVGNWRRQKNTLPDISKYDSVFMKGTYDRFDNVNDENLLTASSSRFNEYTIQDANAITIDYVMKLNHMNAVKVPPRLICEINIKSDEFKYFDPNIKYPTIDQRTDRIRFTRHWYILADISFVLAYTRSPKYDIIDENSNKKTVFKTADVLVATLYIPKFSECANKFVIKANLYNENVIIPPTKKDWYDPIKRTFTNVGVDIDYVYFVSDEK